MPMLVHGLLLAALLWVLAAQWRAVVAERRAPRRRARP